MQLKKTVTGAILTATALILFVIEAQIPPLIPVPGVKIGLSNIVTLYTLYVMGPLPAAAVLLCRILMGNLLTGQVMGLLYSLSGGALSYGLALLLKPCFKENRLWVLSVFCALTHSMGQLLCAALVTGSTAVLWYLPVLLLVSLPSGAFTGVIAQGCFKHLGRRFI